MAQYSTQSVAEGLTDKVAVFLCAPSGTDLDMLPEQRAILDSGIVTRTSNLHPCASIDDFHKALIATKPTVLHYGGHGNARLEKDRVAYRTLAFTKANGSPDLVEPTVIVDMLVSASRQRVSPLLCVVLNACTTFEMGWELHRAGVPCVICWRTIVENAACTAFSAGFYHALMHGRGFADAFLAGCERMKAGRCSIGDPEAHMVVTDRARGGQPVMYADGSPLRVDAATGTVLPFSRLVHGIPCLLPEASLPPDHPVARDIRRARAHSVYTRKVWEGAGMAGVAAAAAAASRLNAAFMHQKLCDHPSLVQSVGAEARLAMDQAQAEGVTAAVTGSPGGEGTETPGQQEEAEEMSLLPSLLPAPPLPPPIPNHGLGSLEPPPSPSLPIARQPQAIRPLPLLPVFAPPPPASFGGYGAGMLSSGLDVGSLAAGAGGGAGMEGGHPQPVPMVARLLWQPVAVAHRVTGAAQAQAGPSLSPALSSPGGTGRGMGALSPASTDGGDSMMSGSVLSSRPSAVQQGQGVGGYSPNTGSAIVSPHSLYTVPGGGEGGGGGSEEGSRGDLSLGGGPIQSMVQSLLVHHGGKGQAVVEQGTSSRRRGAGKRQVPAQQGEGEQEGEEKGGIWGTVEGGGPGTGRRAQVAGVDHSATDARAIKRARPRNAHFRTLALDSSTSIQFTGSDVLLPGPGKGGGVLLDGGQEEDVDPAAPVQWTSKEVGGTGATQEGEGGEVGDGKQQESAQGQEGEGEDAADGDPSSCSSTACKVHVLGEDGREQSCIQLNAADTALGLQVLARLHALLQAYDGGEALDMEGYSRSPALRLASVARCKVKVLVAVGGRGRGGPGKVELCDITPPPPSSPLPSPQASTPSPAACAWVRTCLPWPAVESAHATSPHGLYIMGGSTGKGGSTARAALLRQREQQGGQPVAHHGHGKQGADPSLLSTSLQLVDLPALPVPRTQAAAAYLDLGAAGTVVLTGGWAGEQAYSIHDRALNRADAWDCGSGQWSAWPTMIFERTRHCLLPSPTAGSTCVYALGGEEPGTGRVLSTVEFYDSRTPSWQLLPSMCTERYSFGCTFDSSARLYAVGGDRGHGQGSRMAERVDLRQGSVRQGALQQQQARVVWERISDMTRKRRGHAVCSSLPCTGGGAGPGTVGEAGLMEALLAPALAAQGSPGIPSAGGGLEECVYAYGGLARGWGNKAHGEVYSLRTGLWRPVQAMNAQRALHSMACLELEL